MTGFEEFDEEGKGQYETEDIRDCFNPDNQNIIECPLLKKFDIRSKINKNSYLLESKCSVLLHGDLKNGNILYSDNKISGIIDFADALAGAPEVDLAHYFFSVENKNIWKAFLEGYGNDFNKRKMFFYGFAL